MRTFRIGSVCAMSAAILLIGASVVAADPAATRSLPAPQTTGGKPLMDALKARHSARAFLPGKLPDQVLANLLWAADGINRDDGHRTAPSAMNWQEVDVYLATADGLYQYDPKAKNLVVISTADARAATGKQPFVKDAPLNLNFVADYAKMGKANDQDKVTYAAADTGFISQNVYLYCASEGLDTVVRAMVDRDALAPLLKLRPEQKIVLVQTVGYPAK